MTNDLDRLLRDRDNASKVSARLPIIRQEELDYRARLISARAADEATLSSAFWLHVYDNDTLPYAYL